MGLLLLTESSRDEMLKPFYEMVVSKGNNINFGRFKSILLEHLTNFVGLKNLSLASNYYLAGAARYYFNGDLTFNKDLALFHEYQLGRESETESNNHKDEWNKDVCRRLNILILILRNSYIDTVGTEFEQPEDFGNMNIDRLLKKYGKKIEKYLYGEKEAEENNEKYSTNVGNGYTFEIIYSQKDCAKYFSPTAPGSWCISYSQSNYNMYIRNHNIHYVIFRQDGWEKVKRIPNRDMWVESDNGLMKPQDEYGNSLIALLQSNVDGHPVYITSRWNHGSSDCGSVEADHAYTTEEFMRITGVTWEDLEKIFRIFLENNGKRMKKPSKSKEELTDTVRKLKEVQIRINGGEDPKKHFNGYTAIVGNCDNLRKGLFECFYRNESINKMYFCLVDNGKICFESVFETSGLYVSEKNCMLQDRYVFYDDRKKNYVMYNYRKHSIVSVDGCSKFKDVPTDKTLLGKKYENILFYSVMKGEHDIALLDYKTDIPVKLPNGECWSAEIIDDRTSNYFTNEAVVYCNIYGTELEMVYDLSSREKYFFNIETRQFFTPPKLTIGPEIDKNFNVGDWEPIISKITGLNALPIKLFCIEYKDMKKLLGDRPSNSSWKLDRGTHTSPLYLYKEDGTPFEIRGNNMFRFLTCVNGRVLMFKKTFLNKQGTSMISDNFYYFYDAKNGNVVEMKEFSTAPISSGVYNFFGKDYLYSATNESRSYIYSLDDKQLVMNEKIARFRMDKDEIEQKVLNYIHDNSTFYDSRTGKPY